MAATQAMRTVSRMPDRAREAVRGLAPGYFALVMATGILSVGLRLTGHIALSALLLVVDVVAFAVLVVLTAWRLVGFQAAMRADFADPARAFGFFTIVAGANVLAARLGMDQHQHVVAVLLSLTGVLWLVLGYVIPWTAVLGRSERPVVATANGSWFVWVVASQSVAVVAASMEPRAHGARPGLAILAVVAWSVGVFLYAATGVLVTLRLMLYELRPEDLNPTYWVSMGACAITVLAGARIVEMAQAPMVAATRGLVAGMCVVVWAFASWLIPALVAAGWWRHVRNRVPLRYEATLWSMVFPLGMYSVAGLYLGRADHLPIVRSVGHVGLWVALAVWAAVLVAMLVNLVRTVVLSPAGESAPS